MLTASNKAVDQLILKLLDIRTELKKVHPALKASKMARFGVMDKINLKVNSVSYDCLQSSHNEAKKKLKSISQEEEALYLKQSYNTLSYEQYSRLKKIQRIKNYLEDQIEKTDTDNLDVILSTLSYSTKKKMTWFLTGRPIICIIDEASQCVEPEALLPFKFGFKKLVMVGDHKQLPATVTSKYAKVGI